MSNRFKKEQVRVFSIFNNLWVLYQNMGYPGADTNNARTCSVNLNRIWDGKNHLATDIYVDKIAYFAMHIDF